MNIKRVDLGLGGGYLYQIANRSPIQMMSYFIKTNSGKVIIIDGGNCCDGDGEYLYKLIEQNSCKVDLWMITHGHDDHFSALLWMMNKGLKLNIVELYFSFPPLDWFKTLITRKWMKKLNVKESFPYAYGDFIFY